MKIYFLELINGGLKKKIRAVLNVRVGTNGLSLTSSGEGLGF